MLKEGDFIKYKDREYLILSNKRGIYSFYIVLRRSWTFIGKHQVNGTIIKEHLAIVDNDDPLKLEFIEAGLNENNLLRYIFIKR